MRLQAWHTAKFELAAARFFVTLICFSVKIKYLRRSCAPLPRLIEVRVHNVHSADLLNKAAKKPPTGLVAGGGAGGLTGFPMRSAGVRAARLRARHLVRSQHQRSESDCVEQRL